jgi:hypothetical protein
MIIGVGISSIERSFPLPHGWGIYVPIDYKENKIGWPHLTFDLFGGFGSNIGLVCVDISKSYFSTQWLVNLYVEGSVKKPKKFDNEKK